jgi:hypothetical protein
MSRELSTSRAAQQRQSLGKALLRKGPGSPLWCRLNWGWGRMVQEGWGQRGGVGMARMMEAPKRQTGKSGWEGHLMGIQLSEAFGRPQRTKFLSTPSYV